MNIMIHPQNTQHPHVNDPPIPHSQPILQPDPRAGRSDTSDVSVVLNPIPRRIFLAAEKSPFEDADTMSARGSTPPDQGRREVGPPRRSRTIDTHMSARFSALDHVVPVEEKREPSLPGASTLTIRERLEPTIIAADSERKKYAQKARYTGYALNTAIGLQVALGAMTTGLSAVTSGRQTSITVSILGGLTTIIASYLARARGSNEPDLSITRCKDIDKFLREARAFQMDKGDSMTNEFDGELKGHRERFEELLGNANGERKLSSVV